MKSATAISLILLLIVSTAILQTNNFAKGTSIDAYEKWNFPAGETVYDISITGHLVYFTSGDSEGYPSTLYCLDADTGHQVWNHSATYIYFNVADGQVYIQESTLHTPLSGGILLCLDALSGVELWRNDLNGHITTYTTVDDCIYVASIGSVYSLDKVTGEIKWEYLDSNKITFQSICAVKEYVCVTSIKQNDGINSNTGSIHTLNASSGQKIWSQKIAGYMGIESYYSSLSIDNNVVFASQKVPGSIQASSGSILSFDLQNGTLLWKYATDGAVSDFVITEGILYSATNLGQVLAVNISDGTEVWNYKDESRFGSVFIVDNCLYVGSSMGVYCFSAVDGVEKWSYQASDYNSNFNEKSGRARLLSTNPTYSDGIVYFGWNGPQGWIDTTEHNFYALNAYTGDCIFKYALSYRILASPIITNNTLIIGCSGVTTRSWTWVGPGKIMALDLSAMLLVQQNEGMIGLALAAVFVIVAALAILLFVKKLYGSIRRPLHVAASASLLL